MMENGKSFSTNVLSYLSMSAPVIGGRKIEGSPLYFNACSACAGRDDGRPRDSHFDRDFGCSIIFSIHNRLVEQRRFVPHAPMTRVLRSAAIMGIAGEAGGFD